VINYTCDGCKQPLDSENSVRYVVRLEVYASLDPVDISMILKTIRLATKFITMRATIFAATVDVAM